MIYAALLPLGEAPLLASVRIGKWPKCKSFSGARRRSQRAGEEFSLINYLTLGAGAAASDHFRFELHCSALHVGAFSISSEGFTTIFTQFA